MSTNLPPTARPHDDRPQQSAEAKDKKFDLSLSQTLGGALAAMTAAALGSRLGVAGTIVGAAMASIIAGVAGSLYTASLRTTGDKVKTVWSGRVAGTDTKASIDVVPEPPVWDAPQVAHAPARRPQPALPWKRMLVGAVAVFGLAALALTGLELVSGAALSGGRGTTIEQVAKEKPAKKPTSEATSSDSDSPSPSESESESDGVESESPSAPATPTETEAAPEPSESEPPPSEAPTSAEPSATASQEPSDTEDPTEEPTDSAPSSTDETAAN